MNFPLALAAPLSSTPPPTVANDISGIIDRAPGSLKPWPRNPRKHPERQLVQLMASIREFGFTSPVLTDEDGMILCGHGRVEAAVRLNLPTIPTQQIKGLTQAKKRALVLADNKLGLNSKWDEAMYCEEVTLVIEEAEVYIEAIGITTAEADLIIEDRLPANHQGQAGSDDEDPDGLRPADVKPFVVARPGDLFVLGDHRLLCADATRRASYERLMGDAPAQMVITDMPYNVKIHGHASGNGKTRHAEFAMASGEMSSPEFREFMASALRHMHAFSIEGSIHFQFMDWRHGEDLTAAARPIYGPPKQHIVWVKPNAGMGTFYRSRHEFVYVFMKGTAPHINNFELGQFGRYRDNVWEYPGANTFKDKTLVTLHPTVKPTPMISDALRDCSHLGGLVLDPFAGSGTIVMAAERTKRQARAMELEPRYIDLAIHRWQRLTKQQAVLASTGQTFDALREARMAALQILKSA